MGHKCSAVLELNAPCGLDGVLNVWHDSVAWCQFVCEIVVLETWKVIAIGAVEEIE